MATPRPMNPREAFADARTCGTLVAGTVPGIDGVTELVGVDGNDGEGSATGVGDGEGSATGVGDGDGRAAWLGVGAGGAAVLVGAGTGVFFTEGGAVVLAGAGVVGAGFGAGAGVGAGAGGGVGRGVGAD